MHGLFIVLAAIELSGVSGDNLRARAFFDANNVKVGDPLVLTIDFLGNADFKNLHPPALSRAVDRRDWRLDDASAKTDTYRDARRLTYRVRPLRKGLLRFPPLEFEYAGADGGKRIAKSNEIPVHAKGGAQVVVAEMLEQDDVAAAPEITKDPYAFRGTPQLDDDTLFAWKKACARPSADAFAAFRFPAARMNEAACAIRDGNWSRALSIYRRTEWLIGQTPEVERGMRAALALKYSNPDAELPVWRQVLRPLLVFDWRLRAGISAGAIAALVLLFWLAGKGIKALACLAIITLPAVVCAQSPFDMLEQMHQRMRQQMSRMSFGFGGMAEEEPAVEVKASLSMSTASPRVGEDFEFIISLEAPKSVSIEQLQLTPSSTFGLTFTGQPTNLTDGKSTNPSNVVRRMSVPARYDVPFRGKMAFSAEGMASGRRSGNRGRFTFSFSRSFRADTPPIQIAVRPLPTAGQPPDFAGIVAEGLRIHELCDILSVETNDVVVITYKMVPNGYVPEDFLPKDAAFEWTRRNDKDGRPMEIEYRRFFVADGAPETPKVSVSYYDPRKKSYRRASTGGTKLSYKTDGAK